MMPKDAFNKMVKERGGNPEKYKQDLTFPEELADGKQRRFTTKQQVLLRI